MEGNYKNSKRRLSKIEEGNSQKKVVGNSQKSGRKLSEKKEEDSKKNWKEIFQK